MSTSIYLSDKEIHIVTGRAGKTKARISGIWKTGLPDGCLVNGAVIKPQELQEAVRAAWQNSGARGSKVRLVIGGGQVNVKQLELPALSDKKLRSIIPKEMDIAGQDVIFDYMKLGKNGKRLSVYGASTEEKHIRPYQEIFQELGLKLERISVSRISVEKLLGRMKELQRRTCIIEIFDGQQMNSILWVDGKQRYFMQSHIHGEYGSFQFGLEVSRSVSSMQQFFATQDKDRKINEVCLCGISQEEFLICGEAIGQMAPEVDVVHLEQISAAVMGRHVEGSPSDYMAAVGGLIDAKQEINLNISLKKKKEKNSVHEFWKYAAAPAALAVVCTAVFAGLLWNNYQERQAYQELKFYLLDPENRKLCSEADKLSAENAETRMKISSVAYMDELLASYPKMNSEVIHRIRACASGKADVSVKSYDAESGLLTLNTEAAAVERINQFIDGLQESGLFEVIDYTGYTYSEEEKMYTINVLCYLQEGAGKEEGK